MQSHTTTSGNDAGIQPPSRLYGALFAAVQESGIFADGKTFADAVPLRASAAILSDYLAQKPLGADELERFVVANFALPEEAGAGEMAWGAAADLAEHIARTWPRLERQGVAERGSAIGISHRFVVPGGRFRELYYWDSYFTMLGLVAEGRQDLVEEMIDLFADLIERFGHVPNGTRSYYLSRSQPPVFYLMVGLSKQNRDPRLLRALRREYDYWMSGGRVVRVAGGKRLNRYWDDADSPRDESWAEDIATARRSGRSEAEVWRDLRAGAESGWDFTSRWLADGHRLETIRTTRIVPCCLNALLFGLESLLAQAGDRVMEHAASTRRDALAVLNWNEARGFFADYCIDDETVSDQPTAAMLYPLFTGCAAPSAATRTIAAARDHLLAPGGLRTSLAATGQQWDAPNGWAPLQWIACQAFANHGETDLAQDLAARWIATVRAEFEATGRMLEKYDVERGGSGEGGEYVTQEGFGWTNGVVAALTDRLDPKETAKKLRP